MSELFVRASPSVRSFLMAAGLKQVLDYPSALRFDAEGPAWMHDSAQIRARARLNSLPDAMRELAPAYGAEVSERPKDHLQAAG